MLACLRILDCVTRYCADADVHVLRSGEEARVAARGRRRPGVRSRALSVAEWTCAYAHASVVSASWQARLEEILARELHDQTLSWIRIQRIVGMLLRLGRAEKVRVACERA